MKNHVYQLFAIILLPMMICPTFAGTQFDEIAKYQDPLNSVAQSGKHKIQLATNAKIEGEINDYLVSEKLDGIRGYWDGERLFTRGDNVISAPKWFTQDFPKYPLEGELWMGRGTFEQMSGLVRRKVTVDNDWRVVKFMVFDLPNSSLSFGLRYRHIVKELSGKSAYLAVIEQKQISTLDELDIWFTRVVNQGGEGLMLHRQTSLYIAGRNKELIKLKPFFDAEAMVIRHIPGKGQFEGVLGSILVETPAGNRFKIGTGFTLEERLNPPKVGVMVTYKYYGLTQKGTPRFASFLRVRLNQ